VAEPHGRGTEPADWRTDFLYQFKFNSESIPSSEGVCSKDWKHIRWLESGTEELFTLRDDAHETRNLAPDPAHAADLARMRARYVVLKKEVGGTPVEQLQNMPYGIAKPAPARKPEAGQTEKKARTLK
jgi:arylsulfatase A-like enzyme